MCETITTCTRRLSFCAGHRVAGHEHKCAHLHGHNYVVFVTAEANELDDLGRVIDFGVLKERVGGWLDAHWDHGFIIWQQDAPARDLLQAFSPRGDGLPGKVFLLDRNPTAENLAGYLLESVCPTVLDDTGVSVTRIRVCETENCYAEAAN